MAAGPQEACADMGGWGRTAQPGGLRLVGVSLSLLLNMTTRWCKAPRAILTVHLARAGAPQAPGTLLRGRAQTPRGSLCVAEQRAAPIVFTDGIDAIGTKT